MESERLKGVKVHFVGNQDDVARWYSAADVVAVPSYTESFGLVAVEAMVCAKPLVASNIEGLAEIVEDGVNGLLFPPGNAAELANAILRLIRSPEYSRELGENAKRTVLDRFTLERMIDGWIDCYRRILGR